MNIKYLSINLVKLQVLVHVSEIHYLKLSLNPSWMLAVSGHSLFVFLVH